jgi:hypothetical protein
VTSEDWLSTWLRKSAKLFQACAYPPDPPKLLVGRKELGQLKAVLALRLGTTWQGVVNADSTPSTRKNELCGFYPLRTVHIFIHQQLESDVEPERKKQGEVK